MSQVRRLEQIPTAQTVDDADQIAIWQGGRTRIAAIADLLSKLQTAVPAVNAGLALDITRDQIALLPIPLASIRISGFYTVGDLGAGAQYVRGTADGPMAIRDLLGQWWNLAWSGELNVGWCGAKGDRVTDDSPAFQVAANLMTSLPAQTQGAQGLYLPRPSSGYLLNSQVLFTIPSGGSGSATRYNGISVRGDGHWQTKVVLGENNSIGAFKVQAPFEKHFVRFADFDLISNIDLSNAANAGKHNGDLIYVTNKGGSYTDANPLPGLNSDTSCIISNVNVMSDNANVGQAQITAGSMRTAFLLEFQWLPRVMGCTIRVPNPAAASFPGTGNGVYPMAGFPGLTDPANQNNKGIYFRHCYLPDIQGNVNIQGMFQEGIVLRGTQTVVGAPGRVEGLTMNKFEIGGSVDGVVIDMPYVSEPSLYPNDARITDFDMNCKRFAFRFKYWQLLTMGVGNIYCPNAPWGGETLPAGIYLDSCSDVVIGPVNFTIPGFKASPTSATCGVRLVNATSGVHLVAPKFNIGGYGVHVVTTVPNNNLTFTDSIRITDATLSGRKSNDWANFELFYDPGGKVAYNGVEQTPSSDFFVRESRSGGAGVVPIVALDRAYRSDSATLTTNVPLSQRAVAFTNSAGTNKNGFEEQISAASTASGGERTQLTWTFLQGAGVRKTPFTYDGFSDAFLYDSQVYLRDRVYMPFVRSRTPYANDTAAAAGGVALNELYCWPDGSLHIRFT